jgi:hypothetical protein
MKPLGRILIRKAILWDYKERKAKKADEPSFKFAGMLLPLNSGWSSNLSSVYIS